MSFIFTREEVPIEETSIPRKARFAGRAVRVVAYMPRYETPNAVIAERFVIIDSDDHRRSVPRSKLTFTANAKPQEA